MKAMQWGITIRSKPTAETPGDLEVSASQTHGSQQGAEGEGKMVSSATETSLSLSATETALEIVCRFQRCTL
jgi:hypothetical protein